MARAQPMRPKDMPWFSTPGSPGDRTLDQQLMGLDRLFAEVAGKTVLDVGCAEGLISIECVRRGAMGLRGVEIRQDAVDAANRNRDGVWHNSWGPFHFRVGDANVFHPVENSYDIVLLLAVLHKLRDPSAACRRLVAAAKDLVVIRLPPANAPDIVDARSGGVVHRIGDVMVDSGFAPEYSGLDGPFGEWVGYYRRVST